MEATQDELAGVVDLFGALTRDELSQALRELAFRRGEELTDEAIDEAIDDAVADYALVEVDGTTLADVGEEDPLLIPGPVAFPTLADGAEDLPHILDVDPRTVDRDEVVDDVATRMREEAARAVNEADTERVRHLLDATYDLEAWGEVDLGPVRERLDEAL